MKVIVFRANTKKNKKTHAKAVNPRFGFERFLFFSFIILFSALVLVQAALMNPATRTFLVNDNGLEVLLCSLKNTFTVKGRFP